MNILWILSTCLVVQSAAYPKRQNGKIYEHHPQSKMDTFPAIDGIGPVVQLMDTVLSQLTRNMSTPMDNECLVQSFSFGGIDVQVTQQPFGYCSYCCPIKTFIEHVHLYFTNKAMLGHLVELKIAKKSGAFRSAGVNSSLTTVFYIHGFTEHGKGHSPTIIRDAYLASEEDFNIILVDWGDLAAAPWYQQAVDNVKMLGTYLGKIIKLYNKTGELPISKLHLIGFSLGGHIVGFIGKYLKDIQKVPRITSLDPAFPLFPIEDPSQRISKADAEFIDVIHTDGGFLGYPISLGHADFYPDGGKFPQPGCEASKLQGRQNIQDIVICSHLRAFELYAESVRNPMAFPAAKCDNMQKGSFEQCRFVAQGYMGFAANKNTTLGNFYLTTMDQPPFSKSIEEQVADMQKINLTL